MSLSWDEYGMLLAHAVALKSKDPNTRIGSVALGADHEVLSTGFNGLPRGMKESPERNKKPDKYWLYEHSERNLVYNAARVGISLLGATLYTQGVPCADCARAVIQSGIKRVVVDFRWNEGNAPKWAESAKWSEIMFSEASVSLSSQVFHLPSKIEGLHDGVKFEL